MHAGERQQPERESGEHRDVATGDGDDVIRAGALQTVGDVARQPGSVANQHCRDDCGGRDVVRGDPALYGRPDMCAHVRRPFVERRSRLNDVHDECALDRPEQRRALEGYLPLEIGDAIVQISCGTSERRSGFEHTTCAPLSCQVCRRVAADCQRDATFNALPAAGGFQSHHIRAKRDVVVANRCVLEQSGANTEWRVVLLGTDGVEKKSADLFLQQASQG
jgi:hypothetical protein